MFDNASVLRRGRGGVKVHEDTCRLCTGTIVVSMVLRRGYVAEMGRLSWEGSLGRADALCS